MSTTDHQVDTKVAFKGLEQDELPPPPSMFKRAWTFAKKQPLGTGGLMLVLAFIVMPSTLHTTGRMDICPETRRGHPFRGAFQCGRQ